MVHVPEYFRNSYEHVEQTLKTLQKGKVSVGCQTPGGRNIYVVTYGERDRYERTANYSSALGCGDLSCYAVKKQPCIFLIGGVHGGEFEGTASMLNLLALLETGKDLKGRQHDALLAMMQKAHIIMVPCANADGRSHVPFEGFGGKSHDTLRYYNQGTWADGSLCGWPGCKQVHPMRGYGFLGGYYNDDGINLMHDNFFEPMAEESRLLLHLASEYAPDIVVNLHGAAEMGYGMYTAGCATDSDRENALAFEAHMCDVFTKHGYRYITCGCSNKVPEFNLTTAFYLCCGALSVTWESYQGVKSTEDEVIPDTVYDDILDAHMLFFEETFRWAEKKYHQA
ncbi:MAG: M14 family zinc carboxypeptidase [Clostridia bacterium]